MRSRLLRNLLWSLAVLAVLAGLSFGLPALDNAVASARPVPAGVRYDIGAGVSLVPPVGAQLDVAHTVPGEDEGTALFLLGGVRYSVRALPFTGGLDEVTAQLRESITRTRGYQVTGAEMPVRTDAGVAGRQGGYTSPGRQGRYCAFLAAGTAVEVTFAGGDLELHDSLQALETSVQSITFGRS
ncbi:hypothetical protein [Rugosimonospora africana]|uniref:Uncharacterized protein n=1 Tax=Rugosimonospora africana TaxID=556532 RepID=A0A8J3QNK2_9ACTN|nr:hypothetical protein [Rugosimonospora africana]GIH13369.1 hypothetical protein Raf01_15410 [Rugosimonospora africana]